MGEAEFVVARAVCWQCGCDQFYVGLDGSFKAIEYECVACQEAWTAEVGGNGRDLREDEALADGDGKDEQGDVVQAEAETDGLISGYLPYYHGLSPWRRHRYVERLARRRKVKREGE
jgi:hypothetical protein